MPKLSTQGWLRRYCAPTAKCQVSLRGMLVVMLVGLAALSTPSCTWPNFDQSCQPRLASSAQRSFTWVKTLAISCCGILRPMSMFEASSPRALSSALKPGARLENCAGAPKSSLTSEL